MANYIKLQEGHPVDENLRPVKVGGKSTSLEISQHGNGARITGDLEVTGTARGTFSDATKLPLAGGTMTGDLDATGDFTIGATGDIKLDADGLCVDILSAGTKWADFAKSGSTSKLDLYEAGGTSTDDYFRILTYANGLTVISTVDAAGTGADLTLDADGDITLDSATGVFELKGAGSTAKFADLYAGTILGYTDIGLNEAHATLNLTTSYVVPTDEFSVAFIGPPSGNVEIYFQIQYYYGSGGAGTLAAGLSTANATSGYSALASYHEDTFDDTGARYGTSTVTGSWTLTGLTAGDSYEYWIGFKSGSVVGTPKIQWGGSGSDRYADFIMKAIALPATITT